MTRVYLGDGLFMEWDDDSNLILTTEDGLTVTNRIVMEPEVLITFLEIVVATRPAMKNVFVS